MSLQDAGGVNILCSILVTLNELFQKTKLPPYAVHGVVQVIFSYPVRNTVTFQPDIFETPSFLCSSFSGRVFSALPSRYVKAKFHYASWFGAGS